MIVTSHKHYSFMLLLVTFDLYQGHRVSAKCKFAILNYAIVSAVTFIKLGINITTVDLNITITTVEGSGGDTTR